MLFSYMYFNQFNVIFHDFGCSFTEESISIKLNWITTENSSLLVPQMILAKKESVSSVLKPCYIEFSDIL